MIRYLLVFLLLSTSAFSQRLVTVGVNPTNNQVVVPENFWESNRTTIASIVGSSSTNAIPIFSTLSTAIASTNLSTNSVILVRNYADGIPWPDVRAMYVTNTAPSWGTNIGNTFRTAGTNYIVALDAYGPQLLEWWGAVANGSADCSPAIRAAATFTASLRHPTDMYSNPIGGAVLFPGGVVAMASPVQIPNGLIIKGLGRNVSVVKPTGTNVTSFWLQAQNGGTNVPGQADFHISDLHFLGSGQSNVVFIVSTNMSNQLTIENVKATYGSNLLSACSVEGAHIVNYECSNMQGKALNFYSTSSQANVGVVIESGYVALSGGNFEIKDSYGLVVNGVKCNSCVGSYRLDAAVAATLNGLEAEAYTQYALDLTNFNDSLTINSPYFRISDTGGTNTPFVLRSYSKGISVNNYHLSNTGTNTINGIDDYGTSEYLSLKGYVDSGLIRSIPSWRNGSRWGPENTSGARAKYQTGQGGNIPDFGFSGRGTRRTGFATLWDEGNPSANIVYPMYQSESGTNSYWKVGLSKVFYYTNDLTTAKTTWVNQGSALILYSNHVGATTLTLSTNLDPSTTSIRPLPGTTMSVTDLGDPGPFYGWTVNGTTNYVTSYGRATQDWIWDGTNWVCQGVRFPMPPIDGNTYGLKYGYWNALPITSDAPSDGNEYVRLNGAWSIATGGGGGGATNATQVKINGSAYLPIANFTDDSEILWGASGSTVTATLASASIGTNKLSAAALSYLKDRSTDTGTQLYSTISDADTNVWQKILSSIQPTNGVTLVTNAGPNKLYVGAKLAQGANVTLTTNADLSITIAASSGSTNSGTAVNVDGSATLTAANFKSSTNVSLSVSGTNVTVAVTNSGVTPGAYTLLSATIGSDGRIISASNGSVPSTAGTNIFVNNILSQPAKLTNSATVTWSTNANGDIVATAAGGGGGAGTNIFVNNILSQPAKLTNSATVTWSTNANGDIVATAIASSLDTNILAHRGITNSFTATNTFNEYTYLKKDLILKEVGADNDLFGFNVTSGSFKIWSGSSTNSPLAQNYWFSADRYGSAPQQVGDITITSLGTILLNGNTVIQGTFTNTTTGARQLTAGTNLNLGGTVSAAGSYGTNGQVLTSTGTGVNWTTLTAPPGGMSSASTASFTPDFSVAKAHEFTLTNTATLNAPTNVSSSQIGEVFRLVLIQDSTGNRTLTLATNYLFGTDITGVTLTTNSDARDYMSVYVRRTNVFDVVGFLRGYAQ